MKLKYTQEDRTGYCEEAPFNGILSLYGFYTSWEPVGMLYMGPQELFGACSPSQLCHTLPSCLSRTVCHCTTEGLRT